MIVYTPKDFKSQMKIVVENYLNRVKIVDLKNKIVTLPAAINKFLGLNILNPILKQTLNK